jgi:hypothetical protein
MNDTVSRLLFFAHLASTLYMVGLIWFVQIVHYPLFNAVGSHNFADYERRHSARTTWVVAPPMLVELTTAVLLFWFRHSEVSSAYLWTGLALLAVIWLSTAFIQVPCHNALISGFDAVVHQRLVRSNWMRTIAWSLRGILVLWIAWSL